MDDNHKQLSDTKAVTNTTQNDDLMLNEETESTAVTLEKPGSTNPSATEEEKQSGPEYFNFNCCQCAFNVRARYGQFKYGIVSYKHDVYFIKSLNYQTDNNRKMSKLYDYKKYAVIGAKCHNCDRDICIKVQCSFFYGQNYCIDCIFAKRKEFPEKIIEVCPFLSGPCLERELEGIPRPF